MVRIECYLLYLFSLWLGFVLICGGRMIGCYYPFLMSRKYYYTVKNPKLQKLLIADGKNRSDSTTTRVKDRNKLSIIGVAYYIIQIFLLTIFYVSAICVIILDIARIGLVTREFLYTTSLDLICACMLFYAIMYIISWLDYGFGKLLNPQ